MKSEFSGPTCTETLTRVKVGKLYFSSAATVSVCRNRHQRLFFEHFIGVRLAQSPRQGRIFRRPSMSIFHWPVSDSAHLQPGKYLSADLRRLSHSLGITVRLSLLGDTYVAPAPVEGESGLRAEYLHYHLDRVMALMRVVAGNERLALLASQQRQLQETDLTDEEVGLICYLVETKLPELKPSPMADDDGHAIADHLDVRGANLRRRIRDFFRGAVTLGALKPCHAAQ